MKSENLYNKNDIYAVLTCDTEFLPPWYEGTWLNQATWTFEPGTDKLYGILERHNIKATFFTQATVALRFPERIRHLSSKGHLIGNHGYNHENYGDNNVEVWTKEKPICIGDKDRKRELLIKAHNILRDVIGYEPTVFVAPFDWREDDVLEILNEMGYKVDCSTYNYILGHDSFPNKRIASLDIIEIPLTVLDFGLPKKKNILESFTYKPEDSVDKLTQYIKDSRLKHPFSVVLITCHPWDFLDVKIPHRPEELIVGEKKIEALERLILFLKDNQAEFVNPLDIRQQYLENTVTQRI